MGVWEQERSYMKYLLHACKVKPDRKDDKFKPNAGKWGEQRGLPKREESWMLKFRKRVGTWIIKMACNRYNQKIRNYVLHFPHKSNN